MIIKRLSIEGFRGFSKKIDLNFAVPDGINKGSGLTVLVGPNNSGKSSVIEAIHVLNSTSNNIPKNSRNMINGGIVKIIATSNKDEKISLETTKNGGAYVKRKRNGAVDNGAHNILNAYVLSNKRNFSSTFNNYSGEQNRHDYKGNVQNDSYRNESNINNNFGSRLIRIYNSGRSQFDKCLKKVLNPIPNWTVDALNEQQMYLEFTFGRTSHSSQGAGDGYINIFNIIDSLYDSNEDNLILIDEPEVSLHPDLQKRLFNLLLEYSKDKQIIVSTHSPYFVDWEKFATFSKIIRLRKEEEEINCYELSTETKENIKTLLADTSNLHTLSLDTNDIFFLNDNIILTEGQEDVYGYKKIFNKQNYNPNASFFGWGVGGAGHTKMIIKMLEDLGYKKVFIILDNDRKDDIKNIQKDFPQYCYYAIEANDIRDKDRSVNINKFIEEINKLNLDKEQKMEIKKLIDKRFSIKEGIVSNLKECIVKQKYKETINKLIKKLEEYFKFEEEIIDDTEEKDFISEEFEAKNGLNDNSVEQEQAEELLNDYLKKEKLYLKVEEKYKHIKFSGGTGGPISIKKISKNKYYAIIEQSDGVLDKYQIVIQYHFVIDIKTKKVNIRKKDIIKNTIPKKY